MSLLPSISRFQRAILAALFALLLNGCAAISPAGSETAAGSSSSPTAEPAGSAGQVTVVDAPPKVLTQFEQAVALMAGGEHGVAELRFNEFVRQYPEYPGAFVNLAILSSINGNVDAARNNIERALALNPDHPAALNQLGLLHRRDGNFAAAEAAYLKAITVSPEYALAHYNLGVLNELYLQRLDRALKNFQTYQSLVGEDKQVAKWISDLTRRVAAAERASNSAQ